MKLKYNAPTTLTFSFIAASVLVLDQTVFSGIISAFFCTPGKNSAGLHSFLDFFRLFGHIFGHADWNHLLGNLSYILLLGPILEENFGSWTMALMIFVTALATGLLNVLLFSQGLMGASGIVFMMILLASVTNISRDEIPITFILIVVLYLGREVLNMFGKNNISEFAHLAGGFCGSIFGFMRCATPTTKKVKKSSPKDFNNDTNVDISEFLSDKR